MHAIEMFKGSSMNLGCDDYNPWVYDDMLMYGKKIYCVGVDDNHNFFPNNSIRSDSGLAFTMIKAEKLDYRLLTKALVAGHFYASQGPEIYALWIEDNEVHIECSEADRIACNYCIKKAVCVFDEEGNGITRASFPIDLKFGYFRITVTDKKGLHTCTNAYFLEDYLFEEKTV